MSAEFDQEVGGRTLLMRYRCDDAAGFELRILRAGDGDFHLSVVPRLKDFEHPDEGEHFAPCYSASVRVRAPMIGGGSHELLWHALARLEKEERFGPEKPQRGAIEDAYHKGFKRGLAAGRRERKPDNVERQRLGGLARAASMSPEARSEQARKAARARWDK